MTDDDKLKLSNLLLDGNVGSKLDELLINKLGTVSLDPSKTSKDVSVGNGEDVVGEPGVEESSNFHALDGIDMAF